MKTLPMPQGPLECNDCGVDCTDYKNAVQLDPWGGFHGDVYCERCHERRWDRYQERLMEET